MRGILLGSLLALSIPYTRAHPSTRKQGDIAKRTIDLDAFRLKVSSDYVNATAVIEDPPLALNRRASALDIATELVKETLPGANFRLVETYTGNNKVTHVYFRQTANDIDIDNADFNVNVSIHLLSTAVRLHLALLTPNRWERMGGFSHSETLSTRAIFQYPRIFRSEIAWILHVLSKEQ